MTQASIIKAYQDALKRNEAGKATISDTVIIALWDATFLAHQKTTGLQKQLDEALESNRQSAAALTAMTLRMAGATASSH